jgi:hypothetical protein
MGHRRALLGDLNLIQSVPKVNGFFSLYLRDSAQVEGLLYNNTNPPPSALLDFLGVTQISSDASWFDWQRRPTAQPLVTCGQAPVFADRESTLRSMATDKFASATQVFLPESAKTSVSVKHASNARVAAVKFEPNEIRASVQAAEPSLMVVAQSYAKGWHALIDGHPAPLWQANVAFQALEVPAGSHTVRLRYSDPLFGWGMIMCATALGIILMTGIGLRRNRPWLTSEAEAERRPIDGDLNAIHQAD